MASSALQSTTPLLKQDKTAPLLQSSPPQVSLRKGCQEHGGHPLWAQVPLFPSSLLAPPPPAHCPLTKACGSPEPPSSGHCSGHSLALVIADGWALESTVPHRPVYSDLALQLVGSRAPLQL